VDLAQGCKKKTSHLSKFRRLFPVDFGPSPLGNRPSTPPASCTPMSIAQIKNCSAVSPTLSKEAVEETECAAAAWKTLLALFGLRCF